MGQHKVKKKFLLGMTFQPEESSFQATFSIRDLNNLPDNAPTIAKKASQVYLKRINNIINFLKDRDKMRREKKTIPAILMWNLGDQIFQLIADLARLNVEIEDLYYHLSRDTGVSSSTLEKVIAFRRYFPNKKMFSSSLKWWRVREAPKRYARAGLEGRNS